MGELAPELAPMLAALSMPANFVPTTNAVLAEMQVSLRSPKAAVCLLAGACDIHRHQCWIACIPALLQLPRS